MRKKILYSLPIICIIFLALLLRTVNLSVSPPGFNADEAALGYNAYSLLKTGKDEWGESFPLVFKSFSDYKPGLYVYLALPFVALFGLEEFSVRLPSILLGTLSVFIIYLLAKELFKSHILALSTAFLLSISPWHIHYSRGAWETNVATFFILFGVYGLIKGLKSEDSLQPFKGWVSELLSKYNKWFYLSGISFILSMYTYQSPRLIIPLFILLLLPFYWKRLFVKKVIPVVVLCIFLAIPLVFIITSNKGMARFQGVSIFTDSGILNRLNQDRGEHNNPNSIPAKIYHNRLTAYGLNFLEHYFDHFTPNFLFISGDPLGRNKIPEMGQLYLFEIITIITGSYFLLTRKLKNIKVIFIWLAVSPIAASLTYQTPHALRAENMVIPVTLISGAGLGSIIENILKLKTFYRGIGIFFSILIISFFFSRFIHQYFVHLPKQYALEWEYGFSKLVPFIFENKDKYQKIVVTNRYDQPYILFLFYLKYDPIKYQQTAKPAGLDKYGFSTINSFDKFEFRPVGKEEAGKDQDTLYIGTAEEIESPNVDKQINFPNGNPVFKILDGR